MFIYLEGVEKLIVEKILNNNLILTVDENGVEQIVMGKGLRFINQVGEELKQERIQKVYILKDENLTKQYMRLLRDIPSSSAEIIEEALQIAYESFPNTLSDQLFVTLFDHLVYALERYEKNIFLPNRLLWEVKRFYPNEYAVGDKIRKFLNEQLNINLPEEESANIAFHIVNACIQDFNIKKTLCTVNLLKDICGIIQLSFGKQIDEDSIYYYSFLTHIQFFIQRVLDNKMLNNQRSNILKVVIDENVVAYNCAKRIATYIQKNLNVEISQEELMYLTLHIERIME